MSERKMIEVQGWKMLPCAEGVCQECAVDHPPAVPHNCQSLFYQYKFYGANGRWPTWEDAMAHCTPELQEAWRTELVEHGVKLAPVPEVQS